MILNGLTVNLVSAVGDDWNYVLELSDRHEFNRCSAEDTLEFVRVNNFIMFIVMDKKANKLGCVFSNYVDGEFTIDLYVDEGNFGYIPECFELFTEFMKRFTDRLYGYIVDGDERMMKLGELFGFKTVGEYAGYVIKMREI